MDRRGFLGAAAGGLSLLGAGRSSEEVPDTQDSQMLRALEFGRKNASRSRFAVLSWPDFQTFSDAWYYRHTPGSGALLVPQEDAARVANNDSGAMLLTIYENRVVWQRVRVTDVDFGGRVGVVAEFAATTKADTAQEHPCVTLGTPRGLTPEQRERLIDAIRN